MKLEEYGINYIDTARGYTVSRSIWAPPWRAAGQVYPGNQEHERDASMAADVETGLRNLRTGYIDLYQLHNLPEKDIEKVFGPGRRYRS